MFTTAILIGVYSYLIFSLGLLHELHKGIVGVISVVYILVSFVILKKHFSYKLKLKDFKKLLKEKLTVLCIVFLSVLAFVNLIGALGPELAFDSLWYHLTLPKLYIQNNAIIHIPGGLLYYSDMPKLLEMLYVPSLMFFQETAAKLIHFTFGILTCITLFLISRKYVNRGLSLLVVLVFYSNLVVGWESTTAYVDLGRAYFELLALLGFLEWREKQNKKWLIISALMLGFAITVKLLALGSLVLFTLLIGWTYKQKKSSFAKCMRNTLLFWGVSLLVPLPWFLFSYFHTGNPLYPFFSSLYHVPVQISVINPLFFLSQMKKLFLSLADPISPVYLIFLPIILVGYKRLKPQLKIVVLYSVLAVLIWYVTPDTGGGRFILPYLSAFSLAVVASLSVFKNKQYYKFGICIIFLVSILTVFYRGAANVKYLPVLIGIETRQEFLTQHLNFSYGDFYDTDAFFAKTVTQRDIVLLIGFHNLYYVNFPFIDSSWVKKGDRFNFVALQNTALPQKFANGKKIYENTKTKISLYKLEGEVWEY